MALSDQDRQFLLFSAQCPLERVARGAEQTLLAELDEIRNHQLLELLHARTKLLGEIEELERKKRGLEPQVDLDAQAAQLELELADVAPSPATPRRSTRRPYRP